ncbi:MAG: class I SAM-dependent methyltransferase [Pseudomonadota bacterium]
MQLSNLADSSNAPLSAQYASPGVFAVLSVLDDTRKNNILDLGRMNQNNAEFFTQYNCKLFVENIAPSLEEINAGADIDEFLLNYGEDTKFDAIFTWDLFNYIDLKQLARLISRIKNNCRPDTLMHVVSYTNENIAINPQQFGLIDNSTLQIVDLETQAREFPQYTAFDLLSHLPGFIAQDTWLPKDGMYPGAMEYSFRFNPRNLRAAETSGAAVKHVSRAFEDTNKTLHRSPSLEQISQQLPEAPAVLDLGQRIDANVNAFKKGAGSVFVENLVTSMGGVNKDQASRTDLRAHTIDYPETQRFDLILVWDILNYLQLNQIEYLAEKLRPHCRRGTKLFALSYSHKNMPESPRRFTMGENFVISYNDTPDNYRDIPYFTTLDILRRMRGFKIEKTYLLQEGMQSGITELVLTFEGG